MKRVFLIHGWDGRPDNHWFPWLSLELKARGWEVNAPQMPNAAEPKVKEWLKFLKGYVGKPDTDTYFVGHSLGCIAIARYLAELSSDSPFPKGRGPLAVRDLTTPALAESPLIKGALPSSAGGLFGTPNNNPPRQPPLIRGIKGDTSSVLRAPLFPPKANPSFGGKKGGIKIGGCIFVAGFSGRLNIPEIREFYELPFDPQKTKQHSEKFVMIFSDNDPYVPVAKSLEFAQQLGAKTILNRGKGHFCASDGVTSLSSALTALLVMNGTHANL